MIRWFERIQIRLQQTVARSERSLRRFVVLDVLMHAVASFSVDRMTELAAALSYYGLLALFPLLLVMIALASSFVAESEGVNEALTFVGQYLPGVKEELRRIISQVVAARGPATLIGFLAVLWSASGVFDVLQTALDRAWRVKTPRAFWQQRLVSLAAVGALGILFLSSLVISALTNDVVRNALGTDAGSLEWVGNLIGALISFAAFSMLYKIFPHAEVSWRAAWVGGFLAALLWEIAKQLYGVYLLHFARLNLIYGSVGAIIGLLLWMYISAAIVLFGAELAAALTREK